MSKFNDFVPEMKLHSYHLLTKPQLIKICLYIEISEYTLLYSENQPKNPVFPKSFHKICLNPGNKAWHSVSLISTIIIYRHKRNFDYKSFAIWARKLFQLYFAIFINGLVSCLFSSAYCLKASITRRCRLRRTSTEISLTAMRAHLLELLTAQWSGQAVQEFDFWPDEALIQHCEIHR